MAQMELEKDHTLACFEKDLIGTVAQLQEGQHIQAARGSQGITMGTMASCMLVALSIPTVLSATSSPRVM